MIISIFNQNFKVKKNWKHYRSYFTLFLAKSEQIGNLWLRSAAGCYNESRTLMELFLQHLHPKICLYFFCLCLAKDFPDFSFLKTVRNARGVAQGTKNTPVHLARPGYYDLVGQNFYNSFPDRIR